MHTVKKYTQSYIQQLKVCYKIQIYVNKTKESFQQNLSYAAWTHIRALLKQARLNSLINKPKTTELHKPCCPTLLSSAVGQSIVKCGDLQ